MGGGVLILLLVLSQLTIDDASVSRRSRRGVKIGSGGHVCGYGRGLGLGLGFGEFHLQSHNSQGRG